MKTTSFLLIAVISISFGPSHLNASDVESRFGGNENTAIIAAPNSVKVWRTVGSLNSSPGDCFEKFGSAIVVSTNLAAQLSKVLLDVHSYEHSDASTPKQCLLQPGVVVTFSKGEHDLDVFFCFECDVLIVKSGTNEIGNDFSPSRAEFVRIMKKIFQKDAQIQSLKEQE